MKPQNEKALRDLVAGRQVLVIEDEYVLASELANWLRSLGARVIGPCATVQFALQAIERADRIDVALVDLNLRGEIAYEALDALQRRGIPYIFTTGYDASVVPARYGTAPVCEKPLDIKFVVETLGRAVKPASESGPHVAPPA